jgi:predicted nucleotidyltransferase
MPAAYCSRMRSDAALAANTSMLSRTPGVRLGFLFGSTARATAGVSSDVDVAVDASSEVDLPTLAAALTQALGSEVDVVPLADAGVPLRQELMRDGIVAYEAAPYVAARFRSHTLADLEIDGPWFAPMRDVWRRKVAQDGLF